MEQGAPSQPVRRAKRENGLGGAQREPDRTLAPRRATDIKRREGDAGDELQTERHGQAQTKADKIDKNTDDRWFHGGPRRDRQRGKTERRSAKLSDSGRKEK